MIVKFLRWLIGGCDHNWKVIYKVDVYEYTSDSMPYGKKYHLQCEKCGNLKKKVI